MLVVSHRRIADTLRLADEANGQLRARERDRLWAQWTPQLDSWSFDAVTRKVIWSEELPAVAVSVGPAADEPGSTAAGPESEKDQDRQIVADAAREYEEVPDSVRPGEAAVECIEDDAEGVEESSGNETPDACRR